jgi:ferritin-like metal-binding protein YciE
MTETKSYSFNRAYRAHVTYIKNVREPQMSLDTLHDLMIDELKDLYSAETQLVKALPKMAKAAGSETLRTAITDHLEQTKGQVARLEKVFGMLDSSPRGKKCKAMEGLVEEGSEMAGEEGEDAVRDAGIIAAAQRVEHYEIAAYGSTIAFAKQMGHTEIVEILQATLDEEKACDQKLSALAESEINPMANELGMDSDDEEDDEESESDDGDAEPMQATRPARAASATKSVMPSKRTSKPARR